MPAPLSQALKYVHRLNERNQLQEIPRRNSNSNSSCLFNDKKGSKENAAKLRQEIQPDFDFLMGLFEKMKEQFTREIAEINANLQRNSSLNINGPSNDSHFSNLKLGDLTPADKRIIRLGSVSIHRS